MTIDKPDMLLWMDVETTGLDPDHDRILEVEMRCTDMRGVLCVGGFHRVIGLAERNVSITDENFKAWRMHCANGLLEDALDGGYTEEAAANALEEYVDSLAQSFTLHPAGSNPQFDLDFIGRLCPNLPLHYHRIDMATLRDSLEAAGWDVRPEGETPVASAHRTGTCLDRDIRQYARASSATWPPIRSDTSPRKQQGDGHRSSDLPMCRHPDRLDVQQALNRTNNERNLGMKQTINRISNRVGDWFATLFALTALLLIPHAVIRAIIGQALHQWTPITWLAIHTALTIAALATSLASYAIAALLAPPRPETYQ